MSETALLRFAWIPVAAYLLGSIPFGLLMARLFGGKDVRKEGSGNIGATNVARVAGPAAGVLTLILDAAKGAAPVWFASRYTLGASAWIMAAGLAALAGHCFPVWLKFRGGKGVATAAGIFLAMSPVAFAGAAGLFLIVAVFWRYISLASIAAAAAMPILVYFLWAPQHTPPVVVSLGTLAAALLIIYKHDGNIQRLVQGEEPRFSLRRVKNED